MSAGGAPLELLKKYIQTQNEVEPSEERPQLTPRRAKSEDGECAAVDVQFDWV